LLATSSKDCKGGNANFLQPRGTVGHNRCSNEVSTKKDSRQPSLAFNDNFSETKFHLAVKQNDNMKCLMRQSGTVDVICTVQKQWQTFGTIV